MSQHHKVEVKTEALDAFLELRPPRRLEGEELLASLRRLLRDGTPPMPPEEFYPQRIMVMWRLTRTLARVLSICAEDEPLDSATEMEQSPWHHPTKPSLSAGQQELVRRASKHEIAALCKDGLSLLPPDDLDACKRWCGVMQVIATDLGIERTLEGREGLLGLLHPATAQYAGVTDRQVLAMEELMIDEAGALIVDVGERATTGHFREKYGFSRKEALGLVRLARADALRAAGSSVDEDRALMIANLKDLVARAKEEMNQERELKALKQLAAIQGLTRTEPENLGNDFLRVIAAVATRQDKLIEGQAPKVLEAVAKVTPQEYDEDEDALETYDLENRK